MIRSFIWDSHGFRKKHIAKAFFIETFKLFIIFLSSYIPQYASLLGEGRVFYYITEPIISLFVDFIQLFS